MWVEDGLKKIEVLRVLGKKETIQMLSLELKIEEYEVEGGDQGVG